MWFWSAVWRTASAGLITLYKLVYKVKNGKYPNSSDSFYCNFSDLWLCCNSVGWSNVIWSTPKKRSSVCNVVQHFFIYEFCSDFWLRFSLQNPLKKQHAALHSVEFILRVCPHSAPRWWWWLTAGTLCHQTTTQRSESADLEWRLDGGSEQRRLACRCSLLDVQRGLMNARFRKRPPSGLFSRPGANPGP